MQRVRYGHSLLCRSLPEHARPLALVRIARSHATRGSYPPEPSQCSPRRSSVQRMVARRKTMNSSRPHLAVLMAEGELDLLQRRLAVARRQQ